MVFGKKKNLTVNIGRFVNVGNGEMVFVDDKEKVWTQENISDLIKAYRQYLNFKKTANYYEKTLSE